MKISKIEYLDIDTLHKVLTSNKITETQKTSFLIKNSAQIATIVENSINSSDFKLLMQNRTLQKFRPLKNSYTKWGDKIILAKALGIKPTEIPEFIKKTTKAINSKKDELEFLPPSKLEMIKTYVYRHGSKDELVKFLDWELKHSRDLLKTLYITLNYYSGGVADYFIRPIHRMDNKTLIKVYSVINKNIKASLSAGQVSDADSKRIAKWALIRIYQIQNNSKFINAIKTYDVLK